MAARSCAHHLPKLRSKHLAFPTTSVITGTCAERLHLGCRLNALIDRGDRAEARLESGAAVSADALVGAENYTKQAAFSEQGYIVIGP
jgi:hypothetical protein